MFKPFFMEIIKMDFRFFKKSFFAFLTISLVLQLLYANNESTFSLIIGESRRIKFNYAIDKIAIGNPNIADIITTGNDEVLVNGKSSGITSLLVWGKNDNQDTYYIQVTKTIVPQPLIQLAVQVVEVRISDLNQFGINLSNTINFAEQTIPALFTLGDVARLTKLQATLNLLAQQGKAKVLANPTLVAMSGSPANFHVGGEIPYVISQSMGQSSIEWKPYGITLEINSVGDNKKNVIVSTIKTVVSSPDYSNAVRVSGTVYPVLNSREAKTEVQVNAGTTIVIAGLRQTVDTKQSSGVPLLSQIPLIGYFFKTTDIRKEETEVTVFVTPSFVK